MTELNTQTTEDNIVDWKEQQIQKTMKSEGKTKDKLAQTLSFMFPKARPVFKDGSNHNKPIYYMNWTKKGWEMLDIWKLNQIAHKTLEGNLYGSEDADSVVNKAISSFQNKKEGTNESEWDTHRHIMLFKDGTHMVDLSEDIMMSLPSDPDSLMTKKINVTSDEYSKAKKTFDKSPIHKLLNDWFTDKETIHRVQVLLGTALLGNPANKFLVLHGFGANGKSSLMDSIRMTLGLPYYSNAQQSVYIKTGANEKHSTQFEHIRGLNMYSVVHEMSNSYNAELNLNVLKSICSSDPFHSNSMFKDIVEFVPQTLPVLIGNTLPRITEFNKAVDRRMEVVKFTNDMLKNNDDDMDKFKVHLNSLRGDWLVWLLEGVTYYKKYRKLPSSSRMEADKEEYVASDDEFAEDIKAVVRYTGNERDHVPSRNLLDALIAYKPLEYSKMTTNSLGKLLNARGEFGSYKRKYNNVVGLNKWEIL